MSPRNQRLAFVAGAVALFVATRIVIYASGDPYFDPDSYKYLSGADSLRAGKGLPPVFSEIPVTGGALHVVPGYAWMIETIWRTWGGITFTGIAVVQSFVNLLGFLALAHLFSRWLDDRAAVVVFVFLCLSPSVAWLEHGIMPDSIAPALLILASWLAVMGPPGGGRWVGPAIGAAAAGSIISFEILMRTSSQVYAVIPPLLVLGATTNRRKVVPWMLIYATAVVVPLVPWMLQNHRTHDVFAVSASTGRNLYFSAAWGGTIDRTLAQHELGIPLRDESHATYELTDTAFRKALATEGSLAGADEALRAQALAAYRSKDLRSIFRERAALLSALFVHSPDMGKTMTPLRPYREAYLVNRNSSRQVRERLEHRFKYRFTPEYTEAAARLGTGSSWGVVLFSAAIFLLTFDGVALLLAYTISLPMIFWQAEERWNILLLAAAPAAAFMAMYVFFGGPLYRYQAGLHLFMLATCAAALSLVLEALPRRMPRHAHKMRRLTGQ